VFCGFCSELDAINLKGKGIMSQHFPRVRFSTLPVHVSRFVQIPPRSSCADSRSAPPLADVPVKFVVEVIVQHSAQTAEVPFDEFSCTLPPKVRVVKVVVIV